MALRLFVVLGCLYLLISSREPPWADARVMYETAVSLVDERNLDITLGGPAAFFTVRDGKKYGLYPMGNVITMIPGHLLWKGLVRLPKAPVERLRVFTSHIATSVLAAACCALFFGLARREGAGTRAALLLAMALGTMTILVIYARVSYSEALQAFLVVWIAGLAFRLADTPTARDAALAGFAGGWLLTTKAVNVFALGVVAIYVLWGSRRELRRLLVPALVAVAAFLPWVVLTLWVNRIKTGSFFDTGYTTAGGVSPFSGPFYPALHGYLFSPGKAILLFSPVVLLGLLGWRTYYRRSRAHALFVAALVLAVIGPHLKFPSWYGGWVWGPRYTVAVTPLMLLPAAPWLEQLLARGLGRLRAAALGLLATAGLYVQAVGCAFFWDFYVRMAIGLRPASDENFSYVATVFVPQLSPIVMHGWLAWHKLRGGDVMPPDPPFKGVLLHYQNVDAHWRDLNFDFWFMEVFGRQGQPVWGAVILALLLAGLLAGAWGIVRRLRAGDPPTRVGGAARSAPPAPPPPSSSAPPPTAAQWTGAP